MFKLDGEEIAWFEYGKSASAIVIMFSLTDFFISLLWFRVRVEILMNELEPRWFYFMTCFALQLAHFLCELSYCNVDFRISIQFFPPTLPLSSLSLSFFLGSCSKIPCAMYCIQLHQCIFFPALYDNLYSNVFTQMNLLDLIILSPFE